MLVSSVLPARAGWPSVLFRSLIVGAGSTVLTTVGGLAARVLDLQAPVMPFQVEPLRAVAGVFLSGVVIGVTVGPLASKLGLATADTAIVLFVPLYVITTLLSLVEGLFFTTFITVDHFLYWPTVASQLLLAVLVAWLFRSPMPALRLGPVLAEFLRRRHWTDWAWRFAAAAVLYVPTYLFFGLLVSPVALPYYNNPELELGLKIPENASSILLPLETLRGLLFVLAVFPVVALLRGSRRSVAVKLGAVIAVFSAWTPMIQAVFWPVTLRVAHGLEITAAAFVQGLTMAILLRARE